MDHPLSMSQEVSPRAFCEPGRPSAVVPWCIWGHTNDSTWGGTASYFCFFLIDPGWLTSRWQPCMVLTHCDTMLIKEKVPGTPQWSVLSGLLLAHLKAKLSSTSWLDGVFLLLIFLFLEFDLWWSTNKVQQRMINIPNKAGCYRITDCRVFFWRPWLCEQSSCQCSFRLKRSLPSPTSLRQGRSRGRWTLQWESEW